MKILITGGAGYIGSVTADHLLRAGHEVVVVDNLSHGHRQAVPEGARLVEADLADEAVLYAELEQVEAVMHFAASIEAGESMKHPGQFFENNTIKSARLIEWASAAGVKYIVFSSTAAVYKSKDEPISEMDELGPANVYGESKLMIEQVLKWYQQVKDVKVGMLRYFNAAGASMLDQPPVRGGKLQGATHIIPNILQVPLGLRESFTIFGNDYPTKDGTCVRDYIHVDDLATAHLLTLEKLAAGSFEFEAFNLGNGSGFSNLQVLEAARSVSGHEVPADFGPRREGDPAILIADSSKAKETLGWQPEHTDLETIVRSAWEWYQSHPDGYA